MRRSAGLLVSLLAMASALAACRDDEPAIPVTPQATDLPDPRLRVVLQARAHSTDRWSETVQARPRQLLRFRIVIRNLGETARDARARVELDPGIGLVGTSAYVLRSDVRPGRRPLPPGLARQGVVLDRVAAGVSRLEFSLRVAPDAEVGSRLTVAASLSAQARRAADTAVVRVVAP